MRRLLYTIRQGKQTKMLSDADWLPPELMSGNCRDVVLEGTGSGLKPGTKVVHKPKLVADGPQEYLVAELRRFRYFGLWWAISLGAYTHYRRNLELDASDAAFELGDELWLDTPDPPKE